MLGATESLLPKMQRGEKLRVVALGPDTETIEEMEKLLVTLGAEVLETDVFQIRKVNPGTYLGKGKLEEIKILAEKNEADFVVLDCELSPNQLKNIEKILNMPLLDRPGVIIEIFSRNARTREAKLQVELARLQYLLPRLVHFWTHFEKQAGGIGQKGMGESQIEVDRRLVRRRISVLKDRLKEIEKERKVQRSSRKDVFKVALVGYTNAGKSTLLNALTHSKVLAENKLFATLDSSVRSLDPCSHPPIVAVDTVGFISRLPHSLIASFRSTLEEIREADLLLHVVDGSSNDARHQFEVVQEVLKDLELDEKPEITVLNKADQVEKGGRGNWARLACPGAQWVSALSEKDVKKLRDMIAAHFHKAMEVYEVLIPYADSRMEAMVHEHGDVEVKRHLDKGTFYRVRMDQTWAGKLGLGKYRT